MSLLFKIFSLIVLFSLNLAVLKNFSFFGAGPNFLLILLVLLASEGEIEANLLIVFLSGLILDFYVQTFFGALTFAFLLLSLLFDLLNRHFLALRQNWKFLVVMLISAQLFIYLFAFGYSRVFVLDNMNFAQIESLNLRLRFFPELIYNLIMLYPVKFFWRRISGLRLKLIARQNA